MNCTSSVKIDVLTHIPMTHYHNQDSEYTYHVQKFPHAHLYPSVLVPHT